MIEPKKAKTPWLNGPPPNQEFVWDDTSPGCCGRQITSERIVQYMKSRVAAIFLTPAKESGAYFDHVVKLMPQLSSTYAEWTNPIVKTIVYVGTAELPELPLAPGINNCDGIDDGVSSPHLIYVDFDKAREAAEFGNAVIYIIIKSGPCVDSTIEEILNKLARGLKAPRYEKILIICDSPSTDADQEKARRIFEGYDFSYGEIREWD